METALALHDLAEDHVVVEILERLTSPATALELHVVQDAETGLLMHGGRPWTAHGSHLWRSERRDPHVRIPHTRDVSFAKTGAPDSATTQVFLSYVDNPRFDAMRFTPFGEVVEGMCALDAFYTGYAVASGRERVT